VLKLLLRLSFGLFFLVALRAHAIEAVDRKPLVEAAYGMFPGLFKNFSQLKETERQKFGDNKKLKIISERIRERLGKPMSKLVFVRDSKQFIINPGEAPRLMRTPSAEELAQGAEDLIYINEEMLEDPSLEIDFLTLQKFFFHEISHKIVKSNSRLRSQFIQMFVEDERLKNPSAEIDIGVFEKLADLEVGKEITEEDLGLRDQIGQLFENHLRPHLKPPVKVGDNQELLVFSLHIDQVQNELAKVEDDELQPTTLLMLKRNNSYVDLTPNFSKALIVPTRNMRSMWAELSNAFNGITQVIHAILNKFLAPKMQDGMNFLNAIRQLMGQERDEETDEGFKKFLDFALNEIRTVEIKSIDEVELKDEHFVSMKATFNLTRSKRDFGTVLVRGTPMSELPKDHPMYLPDNFLVNLTLQFNLPKDNSANLEALPLHVQLRPDADLSKSAKVGSITPSHGQVQSFKVKFQLDEAPHSTELPVRYGDGVITLKPSNAEKVGSNEYVLEFSIDPNMYKHPVAFIADSLLINHNKTLFLDRLISLNSSGTNTLPSSNSANEIIPGTAGIWGLKNGQVHFAKEFDAGAPIDLSFGEGKSGWLTVRPTEVALDFQMRQIQKIREVRFHYKLASTEVEMDPEQPPTESGGRIAKTISKKETHEIISIPGDEIQSSATAVMHSRALFAIPLDILKGTREEIRARVMATQDKKDFSFIVNPLLLEVVTEDLQTHRHYFHISKKDKKKNEIEEMLEHIKSDCEVKVTAGVDTKPTGT